MLNGEKVRVIFSLDCCDREIMSYAATTAGISSEMVCDVLVQSMERRFGVVSHLPHMIEWLTDNGSCYIAHATRVFAQSLGFVFAQHLSVVHRVMEWLRLSSKLLNGLCLSE